VKLTNYIIYCSELKLFLHEVGVSLDETVEEKDVNDLLAVFGCSSSAVSTR